MRMGEEALQPVQQESPVKIVAPPAESETPRAFRTTASPPFSPGTFIIGTLGVATIILGLAFVWKSQRAALEPPPFELNASDRAAASAPSPLPLEPFAAPQPPPLPATPALSPPPSSPPALTLNGVVVGVGEPFAIINGGFVRLGETIDGATLLEVTSDSAKLRWQEHDLVLRMSRAGSSTRARDAAPSRSSPPAPSSQSATAPVESDEDATP